MIRFCFGSRKIEAQDVHRKELTDKRQISNYEVKYINKQEGLHCVEYQSECYRVLKCGGYCAFTVPIIVDRPTTSREGLPPSYRGCGDNRPDYLVYTEYRCDAWKQTIQAGFQECRLFSIDYPSDQALVAVK